jgi:ABC-2 type transport system permease protein
VIRAELHKLATTRLWLAGLVGAVLCGGGLVGLGAIVGLENGDPPLPGLGTPEGVRLLIGLAGLTVLVPALLGAVTVTAEYRHRTIGLAFLAAPRRWPVLTAKLMAALLAGAAFGLVAALSAGGGLYLGAAVHSSPVGLPPAEVGVLLARLGAAMAAYTVLGAGVAALLRDQTLTLAVLGGYLYVGEFALLLVPGVNAAYPYLPGGATAALTGFTVLAEQAAQVSGGTAHLLGTAGGALVLAAYAGAAACAAVLLPLRRDVT